jgi:hypothetical protein
VKKSAAPDNDIPHAAGITHENFIKYRKSWLLWRALGHYSDGLFVAPISFNEALQLPKNMLDVFFELDTYLVRMQKHQDRKKPKEVK